MGGGGGTRRWGLWVGIVMRVYVVLLACDIEKLWCGAEFGWVYSPGFISRGGIQFMFVFERPINNTGEW